MILTREKVSEAIAFGKSVLPKLTAVELASVLEVSLTDVLKCIKLNQSAFKFDIDKNIVELQTNKSAFLNSSQVSAWFNEKHKNTKFLVVQTQATISENTNSPIRWNQNFSHAVSVFIDPNKDGLDAIASSVNNYGELVSKRVTLLGRIDGGGTSVDKFIYGVILESSEIESRTFKNPALPLYYVDWAYQDMSKTLEWVDVNTSVISAVEKTVETVNKQPESVNVNYSQQTPKSSNTDSISPKKVWDRRRPSNEQLLSERKKMIETLVEAGGKQEDMENLIMKEKIASARIIFEATLQDLKKKRKKMTSVDIKADIKSKANILSVEDQKPIESQQQRTPEQIKDHGETFGFLNKVIPPKPQEEIVETPKSEVVPQENGIALLQNLLQAKN